MANNPLPLTLNLSSPPPNVKVNWMKNRCWILDNLDQKVPRPDIDPFPVKTEAMMACWILQGGLDFTINLEKVSIRNNQMLVIMPGCVFQIASGVENTKFILMAIDADVANDMLRKLGLYMALADRYYHYLIREINTDAAVQSNLELYKFLKKELLEPDYPNKTEVINRLFEIWIIKILALEKTQNTSLLGKSLTRKEQIFRDFLILLDKDFRRERSISYYADRMCLTPKYLSTIIREVSGKHGMQWIDEYVALEAKALLHSSEMSVKQISDALNFPSQSMFGRFFRKMTGYSPKQYKML